jgi:hypothetical protein
MKVKIQRTLEAHKTYGKISTLEFPNKSKIYIHKKGWTLNLPKDKKHLDLIKKKKSIEMSLTWAEINLALRESLLAGYKEESSCLKGGIKENGIEDKT